MIVLLTCTRQYDYRCAARSWLDLSGSQPVILSSAPHVLVFFSSAKVQYNEWLVQSFWVDKANWHCMMLGSIITPSTTFVVSWQTNSSYIQYRYQVWDSSKRWKTGPLRNFRFCDWFKRLVVCGWIGLCNEPIQASQFLFRKCLVSTEEEGLGRNLP